MWTDCEHCRDRTVTGARRTAVDSNRLRDRFDPDPAPAARRSDSSAATVADAVAATSRRRTRCPLWQGAMCAGSEAEDQGSLFVRRPRVLPTDSFAFGYDTGQMWSDG